MRPAWKRSLRRFARRVWVTTLAVAVLGTGSIAFIAASAPASTAHASGLPWSSGVYAEHSADEAMAFGTWRRRPVDNISVFPDRGSWASMNSAWYLTDSVIPKGFKGDIVAAVPLWPQGSDVSANADGQWRTFAQQLADKDPDAYVRLGWEMNIGQYWKVTAANRTEWIAAFTRAVNAMHSVAPGLRIVWNPNWGGDQTGTSSRDVFQAVKSLVDVYAIDIYDSWPANGLRAGGQQLVGPGGLADSLAYAKANGKKFAVPEWGVACDGGGCQWQGHAGGDNAVYIAGLLAFLAANADRVAFESYFNEPAAYIRSALYPTGTNPAAGNAYVKALTGIAAQPDPGSGAGPGTTPSASASPSPSASVTGKPTASPSESATPEPSESPSPEPTWSLDPSTRPTAEPTDEPSHSASIPPPTTLPTWDPSEGTGPTTGPTGPTDGPTTGPSEGPTVPPTASPTDDLNGPPTAPASPTDSPTASPTASPTDSPSSGPTISPTTSPTTSPTDPATPPVTPPVVTPPVVTLPIYICILTGKTGPLDPALIAAVLGGAGG
ncbi:hypothetical protein ACIB24_14440 [Spongisporangium articulatum]|uniref:GH26 domain-containing protein n=1 Tax=Spongisporangium articulatum TaxID=3362603 RepID=A0ABW8APH1_9ACTN